MSKPTECPRPKVNPRVNYRLWVIMMPHSRFISCNKCTTLLGDFDNGGGYECKGQRIYEKSLYILLNFSVNLKLL